MSTQTRREVMINMKGSGTFMSNTKYQGIEKYSDLGQLPK
jgi:hypothetical protein